MRATDVADDQHVPRLFANLAREVVVFGDRSEIGRIGDNSWN